MFRARLPPDSAAGKKGRAPTFVRHLVGIPTFCYYFYPPPTMSTFSSTFVRNIPTCDHSSTLKRRPQTVNAAEVWVCAPPRTIRKCYDNPVLIWVPDAHLLLQTWCGSAPRRGPLYGTMAFWITRAQDPCRIFRTEVDEKHKSGWKIKIVAVCGYTHQIVGQKWVPGGALLSRGRLARRRARNIVQVHAHALNGSWECYHVVKIGLVAIWCDHGRRPAFYHSPLLSEKGVGIFVHFPKKIVVGRLGIAFGTLSTSAFYQSCLGTDDQKKKNRNIYAYIYLRDPFPPSP